MDLLEILRIIGFRLKTSTK